MVTIPAGGASAPYFAQALGIGAAVTHTASAAGFISRTATTTLAPSGIVIAGPLGLGTPFFSASLNGGPVPVDVYTAVLNSANNSFVDVQSLRGGISLQVSLNNSSPGVGTIASPVSITGGSGHAVAPFTPVSQGSTMISVLNPAGFVGSSNLTSLAAQVTP